MAQGVDSPNLSRKTRAINEGAQYLITDAQLRISKIASAESRRPQYSTISKSRAERSMVFFKGLNNGHRAEKKCTAERLAWNVDSLISNAYITIEFHRSVFEAVLHQSYQSFVLLS